MCRWVETLVGSEPDYVHGVDRRQYTYLGGYELSGMRGHHFEKS